MSILSPSHNLGLPYKENSKLFNNFFLSTSKEVKVLDMVKPLVNELMHLEKGCIMYDANQNKEVLVIAPLFITTADNERASELVNHLGCSANLFCSLCDVSWSKTYFSIGSEIS